MKLPLRSFGVTVVALLGVLASRAEKVVVPDWALPGSATHQQVPPPAGFHRDTVTLNQAIGIFENQSDVGGPILPGGAIFDAAKGAYTIQSAGYNIWYFRDEFRFLWRRMSGDVSLAADIEFPNAAGYDDRKVVLIVRQGLDDNAQEIMAGLHGAGLIHLARRPAKGADLQEDARVDAPKTGAKPTHPVRIGLEKRGDQVQLYVSQNGEPMRAVGKPATFAISAPFYVGVGFCSHVPDQVDAAVVSRVALENRAGLLGK